MSEKMKVKKSTLGILVGSLLAELLFPGIFLYCHNTDVSLFNEVWPATLKYTAIAIGVAAFCVLYSRDWAKGILITEFAMLFLMNFNSIHGFFFKRLPSLRRVESLVGCCLLILLFAFIVKKKGNNRQVRKMAKKISKAESEYNLNMINEVKNFAKENAKKNSKEPSETESMKNE